MISRQHLIGWSQQANASVVAICDPILERARARAAEFDIPHAYATLREMLDGASPDALDIISPRQHHAEAVLLAAGRGLPCMCQKPLAPTFAEANALVAAVAGRTRLMVHENWRFRPYYRQIGAWLREGRLGRPIIAQMATLSSGFLPDHEGRRPALDRQPFLKEEPRLIVAELLIHHLDVLRWLLGPLTVLGTRIEHSVPEILGECAAVLTLETESHAPVSLAGSFVAPGYPTAATDRFDLIGDRASIHLSQASLSLLGQGGETIRYDAAQAYQASFTAAIAHFCDCLRREEPFETDALGNLATLALVDDAYRLAAIA